MRDIRPDLKERLENIAKQRQQLQESLVQLKEQEDRISDLLKVEDSRFEAERESFLPLFEPDPETVGHNGKYGSPVARFVFDFLHENKEASLQMLKRGAAREGIPFGRKNPGRALHFLLVGMAQNGLVEKMDSGQWKLKGE